MSSLNVGWYNPKSRKLTHIEPWEDSPDTISFTAILLKGRYQGSSDKYAFPSYIWVAFDMAETLRIFFLNQNPLPKQCDLDRIKALIDDIRSGGGVERVF